MALTFKKVFRGAFRTAKVFVAGGPIKAVGTAIFGEAAVSGTAASSSSVQTGTAGVATKPPKAKASLTNVFPTSAGNFTPWLIAGGVALIAIMASRK